LAECSPVITGTPVRVRHNSLGSHVEGQVASYRHAEKKVNQYKQRDHHIARGRRLEAGIAKDVVDIQSGGPMTGERSSTGRSLIDAIHGSQMISHENLKFCGNLGGRS
jgi:hypothetical protein